MKTIKFIIINILFSFVVAQTLPPKLTTSVEDVVLSEPSLLLILNKTGTVTFSDEEKLDLYNSICSILQPDSNIVIISSEKTDSVFNNCWTKSCIREMVNELNANQVLIWSYNKKRNVLQLELKRLNTDGEILWLFSYCQYDIQRLEKDLKYNILRLYNKSGYEKYKTKNDIAQWQLMIEYHFGKKNVLLGAGAIGFLTFMLYEEDKGPGMGLPPYWPGE